MYFSRLHSGVIPPKTNGRISFPVALYFLIGLASSYIMSSHSIKMGLGSILVLGITALIYYKPQYILYLLFFALIMITDSAPKDPMGAFVITDIDLKGLPSGLISLMMALIGIYFFKLYFIQSQVSVISTKYLFILLAILVIAVFTGIQGGWNSSDDLRLEFMMFLIPALCFYLCVNLLDDFGKISTMLIVLMVACFIKSTILNFYYLIGLGWPYGAQRIVSQDSAELMAFSVIILWFIVMFIHRQFFSDKMLYLTAFMIVPMAFALIFSLRRGHWIGMILSMFIIPLWISYPYRKRFLAYMFYGFLMMIAVLVIFASITPSKGKDITSRISQRVMTLFDPEQGSNKHHFLESVQTMKDILQNPFFGLGLASSHSPVEVPGLEWDAEEQPLNVVHNTFVYIWMKCGFPGLIFFLWCGLQYIKLIYHYIHEYHLNKFRIYATGIGSSLGVYIIMFLTGPVPWYFHQTFLIALFSAMVVSLIRLEKQTEKS